MKTHHLRVKWEFAAIWQVDNQTAASSRVTSVDDDGG